MMFAKDILSSQKGSIIFDVKCSNVLPEIIKSCYGEPIMSPTGHFHIKNGIKKHNPLLAGEMSGHIFFNDKWYGFCLLYTSPSPRDATLSRMPSSA